MTGTSPALQRVQRCGMGPAGTTNPRAGVSASGWTVRLLAIATTPPSLWRPHPIMVMIGQVSTPESSWLSIRSQSSILSVGSSGSILSIASVGSVLSIASVGSFLSAFSVGSVASVASVLSAAADRSVLSWRTRKELMGSGGEQVRAVALNRA
jgi:hypothetical protein